MSARDRLNHNRLHVGAELISVQRHDLITMAMLALLLAVVSELSVSGIPGLHVDTATSTWRDSLNRTRLWHGTNFVEKTFRVSFTSSCYM